ncbi:MAG: hypothetical protein LQ341_005141, partial [Variospora aurantia]
RIEMETVYVERLGSPRTGLLRAASTPSLALKNKAAAASTGTVSAFSSARVPMEKRVTWGNQSAASG